ncbi:hypothetical protein HXX76_010574 [Chlamydomonas incerta]|uniref:Uncharacterized protein n=1 Tax=Chlamydomonas incerta TaxID=51695 RepID=A0A835VVU2_CHLIN|nr:hypothetical protein HXX76_010574 [Chlamydomonas incerta]|eukprot:KAG2429790.1 hypothetical protein HXX76_010574 [Chlamydomonas incerta]
MEVDPASGSAAAAAAAGAAAEEPLRSGAQVQPQRAEQEGRAEAADGAQAQEQQAAGGAEQQDQEGQAAADAAAAAAAEADAAAAAAAEADAAAAAAAEAAAQVAAVAAGIMPFGRYAGRLLTHVPVAYVSWMCQQEGMFQNPPVGGPLRQRMLQLNLIQPAPPGAVTPVSGHPYLSHFQPVWRVAPATAEEAAAAEAATMAFGMHAGLPLSQLPANYIQWMCEGAQGFWNLDHPYKRTLLRHLEVLGRVTFTAAGDVVLAAAEQAALPPVGAGWWDAMHGEDWDNNHAGVVVAPVVPLLQPEEEWANDEGDAAGGEDVVELVLGQDEEDEGDDL